LGFGLRAGAALKGHGFSRAETRCKKRPGFSHWGMLSEREPIPQGLKAEDIHRDLPTARLKPCPFKTKSFHNLKCNSSGRTGGLHHNLSGSLINSIFRDLIPMPVRWMNDEDARAFLATGTEGRLATSDRAGQPYITPLNYVVRDGKVYFHCHLTGRKLDNIAENDRVCFEVSEVAKMTISEDRPCSCATRYTSVLAFGAARIIEDLTEKAALLNLLVAKHAAGKPFQSVDEQKAATCAVVEIRIDQISGKMNVDSEST
jgi:nitroimidazol reductase NimA-like FMN-containing flavoprotein (pyridoxamine 5'-phosphate oxidase superfamily)